jgi:glycosyltransferase involved in cell wall biosynthesis
MEPLVSIIIPTYNRADKILNALLSIQQQSYRNWEAIVVDDGSKDNTCEAVADFAAGEPRVKLVAYKQNRGAQFARNTGIRAAQGEWIAFLDSDDTWLPESLFVRIETAEKEKVSVVYSSGYIFEEDEIKRYALTDFCPQGYKKLLENEGPMFQGLLVTKEALEKINYLDERVVAFQEWDTAISLARKYTFGFVKTPTYIYDSRNEDSISRQKIRGGKGYEYVFRKRFFSILFLTGPGTLGKHYKLAADWYREGNDGYNYYRCYFLSLFWKCFCLGTVIRKLKEILGVLNEKVKFTLPLFILLPAYLRGNLCQSMLVLPDRDKKIIFIFDDERISGAKGNNGREAFYILKSFSDGGYNVYLYRKKDLKSFFNLGEMGRLIYKIKNLKFIQKIPANSQDFIYGFDSIRSDLLRLKWKKLIYINIREAVTCKIGNVISMPFGMLPLIYVSGVDKNLGSYRRMNRRYRLFFAGNLDPRYYHDRLFRQYYPSQLTRLDGVNAVLESKLDVLFIKGVDELYKITQNGKYINKLVLVQTTYPFKIKPPDWMKMVGQSDFFMCFSGSGYPMCHNAVEAMAVGSIPVIAYHDWFEPELEHGKNAIVYSGKEDMLNKIDAALKMSQEDIRRLRGGTIDYYDRYLSKGCLAEKYEKGSQKVSTLTFFPKMVMGAKAESEGKNFSSCVEMLLQRMDI